jgi:hypothetical protein
LQTELTSPFVHFGTHASNTFQPPSRGHIVVLESFPVWEVVFDSLPGVSTRHTSTFKILAVTHQITIEDRYGCLLGRQHNLRCLLVVLNLPTIWSCPFANITRGGASLRYAIDD